MRAEVQRTWTARRQDTTKETDMPNDLFSMSKVIADLCDADLATRYKHAIPWSKYRIMETVEDAMTWYCDDIEHAIKTLTIEANNVCALYDTIGAAL